MFCSFVVVGNPDCGPDCLLSSQQTKLLNTWSPARRSPGLLVSLVKALQHHPETVSISWLTLSELELSDSPVGTVGMIINLDNSYQLYQPGPFYPDFSAENFSVKT